MPIVPGCTVPSISFVRFGDTAVEILAEAEPFGADTVVVTTGTRSSVKRARGRSWAAWPRRCSGAPGSASCSTGHRESTEDGP